ncbi:hypothetical protein [Psychromonas aquatilis]|uniref:Uncharacterized protein n=1 Tax=Psychromonas aquatilis TaxID=2005072 RepID=A0ABU9GTP0_9GAMM
MKKIILHVGFNKTATTSIQDSLEKNRDQLLTEGFHYPIFEVENNFISNHSLPFYTIFSGNVNTYRDLIRLDLTTSVLKVKKIFEKQLDNSLDFEKVIFSGEHIPLLTKSELLTLKKRLLSKGHQLEVLCYVRKPYSYLCSEMQQQIKASDNTLESISVPIKSNQVFKLNEVFGDVKYLSFEKECKHVGGPVGSFISYLDIDEKKFKIIYKNEGVGNITSRFIAHLNKRHPVIINNKLNPKGRPRNISNFDSNKFKLTPRELSTIVETLDVENAKMGQLLGDTFMDLKPYETIDKFKLSKEEAKKMLKLAFNSPLLTTDIIDFILKYKDESFNKNWPEKYLKTLG